MCLSMNFFWNSDHVVSLMNVLSYRQQTVGRKPTHTPEQGTHSYKSTCLPKHPHMDNCYTMHFEFESCGNISNTPEFYSCYVKQKLSVQYREFNVLYIHYSSVICSLILWPITCLCYYATRSHRSQHQHSISYSHLRVWRSCINEGIAQCN